MNEVTDKSSGEPPTSDGSQKETGSTSKGNEDASLAHSKPSVMKLFHLMDSPEKIMIVVSFGLMIVSEAANLLTPLVVANAYDILVDTTIADDEQRKYSCTKLFHDVYLQ